MKAVVVKAFGGPESLSVVDWPRPSAGAGEAVVAVGAIAVGLADVMGRRGGIAGYGPELPFIPGLEVAGTVIEVGDGVDEAWVGHRVLAMLGTESGGYVEYVAARVSSLTPLPPEVSDADAVALGVNACVAQVALERAQPNAGDRVLVRGAGGGIGVLATQLAALSGATVAAATSSSDRGQRLLKLGATEILDRAGTANGQAPQGFDLIVDTVAGPDMPSFLEKLNNNGRFAVVGGAAGFPGPEFYTALLSNFQRSPTVDFFSLSSLEPAARRAAAETVFSLAANGALKAVIDECLPLEEAPAAHAKLESGEVFGKVVLTTNAA